MPFATGSLGHGPSLAAGLALGKRLRGEPGRVFCLTSDGEWNEGSCWEALIFAQHHRLSNLSLIIDLNGLQGFGTTREVADLGPLADKFRVFGLRTLEIDGHDPLAIREAFIETAGGPTVIVATTLKGCGVSFMENRMEWHYLPLNEDQYRPRSPTSARRARRPRPAVSCGSTRAATSCRLRTATCPSLIRSSREYSPRTWEVDGLDSRTVGR